MNRAAAATLALAAAFAPAAANADMLLDTRTLYEMRRSSATEKARETAPVDVEGVALPPTPLYSEVTVMPGPPAVKARQRWIFVQADMMSADDALDVESSLKKTTSSFNAKTLGTFAGSSEAETAPLITVGVALPVGPRWDIGWAVGYLQGPDVDAHMRHQISSEAYEDAVVQYETRVIRLTNHARYRQPIGKGFEFRLRAGAGLSQISLEYNGALVRESAPGSGITFFNPRAVSGDRTELAFTYDAAPSIAFVGKKIAVDIGLSYTQLGRVGEDGDLPEFDMEPLGLRVAVEF